MKAGEELPEDPRPALALLHSHSVQQIALVHHSVATAEGEHLCRSRGHCTRRGKRAVNDKVGGVGFAESGEGIMKRG